MPEEVWDASSTDVSRWLPPVDEHFYEARVAFRNTEFTNVYNRNGTLTRLWDDDDFWVPACERMTAELTRLRQTASEPQNQNKTMGVTVKHYGTTFPDLDNRNASISTYISLTVVQEGSDAVSTFDNNCEWWFGTLVGQATVIRNATSDPTPVPLVLNGTTIKDQNGTVIMLPPPLLKATSGGGKAIQAPDGSNFTLWIEPMEPVASD